MVHSYNKVVEITEEGYKQVGDANFIKIHLPNEVLNKILKYINGYKAKTTDAGEYFQTDIERIIEKEKILKHLYRLCL